MFKALMEEYTYRYGKIHACGRLATALAARPNNIPKGPFTEPTPAMPEEYKVTSDSITSYKNYYLGAKAHMFAWKNRPTPNWIAE